jgi:hypothetical protein
MSSRNFVLPFLLIPLLATCVLLLGACGTLEVGVELASTPRAPEGVEPDVPAEVAGPISTSLPISWTMIVSTSVSSPDAGEPIICHETVTGTVSCTTLDGTPVPPVGSGAGGTIVPDGTIAPDTVLITGTVGALDFPSGWTMLSSDPESPFADEDGIVRIRITEWSRIRDVDGSIFVREELSKGARLQILASLEDGELVAQQVVVLSPGVPRPEDNPAYTDVTGRVTPLPESPPSGADAIRLFEVLTEHSIVDPGASITVRWAFDGESGAICQHVTPQPLSQTCYQDLPSSGELEVVVPAEARGAIGFWLYVQADDRIEDALVIVPLSAERGCTFNWFFGTTELEQAPLLECPTSASERLNLQAQSLEKGVMLRLENSWLGEDPWLFALIQEEDDQYSLAFAPVTDPWQPGMPEIDANLTPPDGFFQPSRGFGMLWRGEIENIVPGDVQTLDGESVLGWATAPVFEYDATYQCLVSTHGRAGGCFMTGPDGAILYLPAEIR